MSSTIRFTRTHRSQPVEPSWWPDQIAYHDWALRQRRYNSLNMRPRSLQLAVFAHRPTPDHSRTSAPFLSRRAV